MKIDITKLLTNRANSIPINATIDIPKELLNNSLIDDISEIKITGSVKLDEDSSILLNANLTGIMTLKDDITLEPVEYKFTTDLEENLQDGDFILDITDIIWQNILTEVPSKVRKTNESVHLSGNGWRVISEEEYESERNSQNNPFASLSELLEIKEDK